MKFAMTYWYGNNSSILNRVNNIKFANFEKVSLHWCDEYVRDNGEKERIFTLCNLFGITVSVFHLSFEKADDIWKNNTDGFKIFEVYKRSIIEASKLGVKYVVMHLTENISSIDDLIVGLERIKYLLELAREKKVIIAFENLQHYDALEKIECMLSYDSAGLCYDTGHFNILQNEIIRNYYNKIYVVHIHNNFGKYDEHNVVSKGNCDWSILSQLLCENREIEYVLEVKNNEKLKEEEFLLQAHNEAKLLVKKLIKERMIVDEKY